MILIKTQAGKAFEACEELTCIDGVLRAHVVTGPYDVIAVVTTHGCLNNSLRYLLASIGDVPGIKKTETCIAVS